METPDGPSVDPSEPEKEMALVRHALREAASPDNLKKIHPTAVLGYLHFHDLDVDDEGFIVEKGSREYAEPHGFSEETWKEADGPADDVFEAYFVSARENSEAFLRQRDRVHLSDLHAIIHVDGESYPVADDVMMLEHFHGRTGISFSTLMSWSDAFDRCLGGEELEEEVSVEFEKGMWEPDLDETVELTCFAPDCEHTAPADEWEGPRDDPECPECGGQWDETITVCTACGEWHWGRNFVGESIHAEPSCPNCPAGMDMLEFQTRYDDYGENSDLGDEESDDLLD